MTGSAKHSALPFLRSPEKGKVDYVTFGGACAGKRRQNALYVTERCVLALRPDAPSRSREKHGVAPHIFESAAEARKDWREETG